MYADFLRIDGLLVIFSFILLGAALMPASTCRAQAPEYASKERARAAVGYYARARAMMVEALEEFEQGRKLAKPDLLVDPEEWRLSVITLTEDLNRLIDPQPLVTRDGVVFRGNPRLIRREHDRLPTVQDGARSTNISGEQQRMKEMQSARAKMYQPKVAEDLNLEEETLSSAAEQKTARGKTLPKAKTPAKAKQPAPNHLTPQPDELKDEELPQNAAPEKIETTVPDKTLAPEKSVSPAAKAVPSAEASPADRSAGGEEKTNEAIENIVRERLKTLESSAAATPKAASPETSNSPEQKGKDLEAKEEDFN